MRMYKHTSATAYITSFLTAVFGGVTLQDVAMAVGILTAIGTFGVNWYYKRREDLRAERGTAD
jgi:multisubunit Na+/H+ antiporter MnhF subunit